MLPEAVPVRRDRVYFLTTRRSLALPIIPPPLVNHGNVIVSLNRLTRWLADRVTEAGVDLFTGFAGQEVLFDGARVIGVRTGDRGLDRHGAPKAGFEAGVDIHAKVSVFCDGVRGNLTKQLLARLPLEEGRQPAAVRRRTEGALAAGAGTRGGRRRDAHAGLPPAARRNSAAPSCTACRTTTSRWAWWSDSTIGIRCSIRTTRSTG